METMTGHPTEVAMARFISGSLTGKGRRAVEAHLAACDACLMGAVAAHEAVRTFTGGSTMKKEKKDPMKRPGVYLILAAIAFCLSFAVPRYFLQFLVATLLLGAKWVADARSTKMLIMIHEAWKRGGDKEVSSVMRSMDTAAKGRF